MAVETRQAAGQRWLPSRRRVSEGPPRPPRSLRYVPTVEGDAIPGADNIKLCLKGMQVGDRGGRQDPQRRAKQAPHRRGIVGRRHTALPLAVQCNGNESPIADTARSRQTATTSSTKVMLAPVSRDRSTVSSSSRDSRTRNGRASASNCP
jgi:hypothetical protein